MHMYMHLEIELFVCIYWCFKPLVKYCRDSQLFLGKSLRGTLPVLSAHFLQLTNALLESAE